MFNRKIVFVEFFILIVLLVANSCSSNTSGQIDNVVKNSTFQPSPSATLSPSPSNVRALCEKLKDLREIPYSYEDTSDDPIYEGLLRASSNAVPCLTDKITDTTLMDDPRTAPHFQDFRVGDAAVFMLLMITKVEWQPETMLSPEYAKRWKSEGVYSYFAYVENPANRKEMQSWWREWIGRNPTK